MARTQYSKIGRAAGLSAMALAAAALSLPTIASAQDQGRRGGGGGDRGGGRGGQMYQNRSERIGDMQQRQSQPQSQPQPQRQYQQPTPPQQAPAAPAARNDAGPRRDYRGPGGDGGQRQVYRSGDVRGPGAGQEAGRNDRNWNGDGSRWQNDAQREAYRNGAGRGTRDDGRRDDRARWQNDRAGNYGGANYGRESWRGNRGDDQNWNRGDNRGNRSWDRGWRSNNRYDWSSYRSRNRNVFSAGRYYSPYQNYSYRRLGIGFSLNAMFYGSRYVIDDPYYYRLPEVYGPYRWVRYYDDVLLVDIYTGEVVDAIYDFFW